MIYFDDAATSRYKPSCVKRAVADSLKHSANPGRGSHDEAIRGATLVEQTRADLAAFVGASRANVIFTKNCTEALNLAILGTARAGGHVVTTVWEHNSVLRPLTMLQKEGLISLTIIGDKGEEITAKEIARHITEDTYLVAVTAMSNVTGYAPPLFEIGELCAKRGVKLLVDGAQALGHLPIDFDKIGIDLLAGAGHKGLHGTMGTGFLIYRKHTFVTPLLYGGTGTESDNLSQPTEPPESLEAGTINLTGIAALRAGLNWTKKHFEKTNEGIADLSFYLHDALKDRGINVYSVAGSPILSFALPKKTSATVADLLNSRYGIAVRAGLHCAPLAHKRLGTEKEGLVRVSFGCHNTMSEAKKLIRAIDEIASTKCDK